MLETYVLWVFTKRIGRIVEEKDQKSGWYKVLTVVLWLGGEIAGVAVGSIIADKYELSVWIAYLFGWVGAALGAGMAYLIANKLSSVNVVSPRVLGCAIASCLLACAFALVVALFILTPDRCVIQVVETETFIIHEGSGAYDECTYALTSYPDVFKISFRPPRSPVICKEMIDGIEFTVVDTDPNVVIGRSVCRHLNEQ